LAHRLSTWKKGPRDVLNPGTQSDDPEVGQGELLEVHGVLTSSLWTEFREQKLQGTIDLVGAVMPLRRVWGCCPIATLVET